MSSANPKLMKAPPANHAGKGFYDGGDMIPGSRITPSKSRNVGRRPDATSENQGAFWKTAVVLWISALCGVFLVLPYVATLENKALAAAAARTHLKVGELLTISVVQTAILLAIAVILGQWAARKLGLGTPLIAAFLARLRERSLSMLVVALALGIATALALMMLDHWIFTPIPAVAELIHNVEGGSARPSAWQGLLASFYGAVTEEILMRPGLLSLLALAFRTLARISDWGTYQRLQHLRRCRWCSSSGPLY